jgi:hypothetical protein
MPEQSYRPRHQISRQFTEAELAVSDRATSHLTQQVDQMPAARLSVHGSTEQAYAWLEKDLARRDAETARLANEMQLAEAQSLRKQLDVEAREDADRKAAAADGISRISKWEEGGYGSMEEAKQALLKENPQYATNSDFNAGYANLSKDFKTDQQRELEQTNEQLNLVTSKLSLGQMELTREFYDSNPELFRKMMNARNNAAVIGAFSSEQKAQMDADLQEESYRRTKRNQALYNQSGDGDPAISVQQIRAFKDAEMNVVKPSVLQSFFPPDSPQMLMATDIFFLKNELSDTERSGLEANYNVLTNPKASEDDKFVAQAAIESTAADYLTYSADLKKKTDADDAFRAKMPDAFKAMNDGVKAGYTILKTYQDKPTADPQIGIDAVVDNAKRTLQGIKAQFISAKIPLEQYSQVLKEIHALGEMKVTTGAGEQNVDAVRKVAKDVHGKLRSLIDEAMTMERTTEVVDSPIGKGDKSPALKPITGADYDAAVKEVGPDKDALIKHFEKNGFAIPKP